MRLWPVGSAHDFLYARVRVLLRTCTYTDAVNPACRMRALQEYRRTADSGDQRDKHRLIQRGRDLRTNPLYQSK